MAFLIPLGVTFNWGIEQSARPVQLVSPNQATSTTGSDSLTSKKMKYYSSTLSYGANEIFGSKPIITELCIPLMSSRDDDIKKLAEKKQLTIEYQTLLGVVPPSVRTLRKVHTPPSPLDVTVLDTEMKSYIKTLKALNIHPTRLYTAVVTEDMVLTLQALRDANLYILGLHSVELILSVQATHFREVVEMKIRNKLTEYASEYIYKDKSDPEDLYKVNIKMDIDPYSLDRNIARVREALQRLGSDRVFSSYPQQHRIEILNSSLP